MTNHECVIWVRNHTANFELYFCHDTKKFYMTQLTFNLTSEISRNAAHDLCKKSEWDSADYEDFFAAA